MKKEEVVMMRRFVRLVRVHAWRHPEHLVVLSEQECDLLATVVKIGGYPAERVVCGKVEAEQVSAGGVPNGEKILLNPLSRYKVVIRDGSAHGPATRWLNNLIELVCDELVQKREHEEPELIAEVWSYVNRVTPVPEGTTAGSRGEAFSLSVAG